MLKINNLDKILAINSQSVEILSADQRPDYYEFAFMYDKIHSTVFSAHMDRHPNRNDKNSFTMKLWDGINSTPLEYGFGLHDVKDPFTLLNYLKEVLYDWDNVTNK